MVREHIIQESGSISIYSASLCTLGALLLGLLIAGAYMHSGNYSRNFVISFGTSASDGAGCYYDG